jgi:hypothetical protein
MYRYLRKIHLLAIFIFVFPLFISIPNNTTAQEMSQGEQLFQPCKACHLLTDQKLIGPGLEGITERRTREWLIPYIQNSQAVINSGDEYAVALWEEYQIPMPPYDYTDEEVNILLDYIESGGVVEEPPAEEEAETVAPVKADLDVKEDKGYMADTKHPWANFRLSFITSLILILLSVLDLIFFRIVKARFVHLVIIIISVAVIAEITILEAQALGRQQYYEPDQPVLFSHKVHAGQNQIDCQYCHTTVTSSKSAGIPSVQLCMNCHNVVKEGTHSGTVEIDKIYKAIETGKPIEWVRVHNLPDHAYFNHAQHVGAGQLDCTECHGVVEEMDRIQQVNDLGMGWCIECHRTMEVNFEENGFYAKYWKLHEELKAGTRTSVTVDDVGGTNCSKCHY